MNDTVRIDKWLWASRFFKTRATAREAINGGKVHLNGARVKPGKTLKVHDVLQVQRGEDSWSVTVLSLDDRRGPASLAAGMFTETEESRRKREDAAEKRKLQHAGRPAAAGRPDKKQRRKLIHFNRAGSED